MFGKTVSAGAMLALLISVAAFGADKPAKQPKCCATKTRCCTTAKVCCDQPKKAECCLKKVACCDMKECCGPKKAK